MNIISKTALSLLAAAAAAACSDVDIPEATVVPGAYSISHELQGKSVVISWAAPADAQEIILYKNAQEIARFLPTDPATYTVARQRANREVVYTVKVLWPDGSLSQGISTSVYIAAEPAVPAMLLPVADPSELDDDDEIAAYQWFVANYPGGKVLTSDDIKDETCELDPDMYSVVWIHIDRTGIASGYTKLPKTISGTKPRKVIKKYAELGGNLLLTKHATQMTQPLGIVDNALAPMLFGSGDGGEGTDHWTANPVIGEAPGEVYDHSTHPIFSGLLTLDPSLTGFLRTTIALEGPGWREDHNCCWDLNTYGFDANPNTVKNFEDATSSTVLATWGHVRDYCVAGIVEFTPTATRPGRHIALGLNAYEWCQNDRTNIYQANIERLTKNCIDYLAK